MPFRPEKITDVDVVERKRKYSPSEVKQKADEARSMLLTLPLKY